MDLQGSLVDTNLRIYPNNNLLNYLKSLPINEDVPENIAKLVKGKEYELKKKEDKDDTKTIPVYLDSKDIENLNKIKSTVKVEEVEIEDIENISKEITVEDDVIGDESKKDSDDSTFISQDDSKERKKSKEVCNNAIGNKSKKDSDDSTFISHDDSKERKKSKEVCNNAIGNEFKKDSDDSTSKSQDDSKEKKKSKEVCNDAMGDESKKDSDDSTSKSQDEYKKRKKSKEVCNKKTNTENSKRKDELHLTTSDIDWLYNYLHKLRRKGEKGVPYLHTLLEGTDIGIPENQVIKRNPILEARCVKLRAQQEAREYRKMTKSVDNVRMRFPEDSISYQLKQVNRQLIAIGQFIISIFAGFLFGFKGLEWMVGNLDFGFRLLMGVMCALIIALAEIYFLAKKLNEELNVPETVQLGGPPKFADPQKYGQPVKTKAIDKEHQD